MVTKVIWDDAATRIVYEEDINSFIIYDVDGITLKDRDSGLNSGSTLITHEMYKTMGLAIKTKPMGRAGWGE